MIKIPVSEKQKDDIEKIYCQCGKIGKFLK